MTGPAIQLDCRWGLDQIILAVHAPSKRSHCQSCGSPLHGPYCSACGQHDVDYSGSIWHIVEDALEGALHFDGKFFRSARFIFTRPGFLTQEFIAGRRARYMHPVRLYIFASFLFFAVSLLPSHDRTPNKGPVSDSTIGRNSNAPAEGSPRAKNTPGADNAPKIDSDLPVPKDAGSESWLDHPLRIRVDPKDKLSERDLANEFWHLLPAVLILCLPLLALVLKLVYFRSGRSYFEHLIFALHVQALSFLSFIVIRAVGFLGSFVSKGFESVAGFILLLGMFYLIYRSFLAVYRQGRTKTVFKLVLGLAGYGLILIFALAGLAVVSAYLVNRNA